MQDIMGANDIAFPNLGIYLENVPIGITVFGFTIAYYGIIIAIGVMSGFILAVWEAKKTGQDPDIYWDFSIYGIIFSILGARIYYVVFAWEEYRNNIWSVFNIRNGGLAIYGAVIAAFLTLCIYAKCKKLSMLQMADTAVLGLVLGQIIGRWGNFMNREAFGEYTDSLFAMRLPLEAVRASDVSENIAAHIAAGTNYIQVHPTFLYESLWNVMVLLCLLLYRRHKKFQGEVFLLYFAGYGIGRYLIEGIRTDQLLLPFTTIAVSQVLAVLMTVVSLIIIMIVRYRQHQKK